VNNFINYDELTEKVLLCASAIAYVVKVYRKGKCAVSEELKGRLRY
jgi:hypothetical protein